MLWFIIKAFSRYLGWFTFRFLESSLHQVKASSCSEKQETPPQNPVLAGRHRGEEGYGEAFDISEMESVRSAPTEDAFTHVWPLNDKITVSIPKVIQASEENGRKTWVSERCN